MSEPNSDTAILQSLNDPVIADPLSPVTRNERKALLIASVVAVAIAKGGLIPKRIEALGIDLSPVEIKSLLYLTALALTYLITGFSLYAFADFRYRRLKVAASRAVARPIINEAMARFEATKSAPSTEPADPAQAFAKNFAPLAAIADQTKLATQLLTASTLRFIFEFHLPVLVGLVALTLVLIEIRGFPGWQWVVSILGMLAVFGLLSLTLRKRKKLAHRFKVKRNHYYMWKMKKLTKRLEQLKTGSLEHVRTQEAAKAYLDKAIKGPWV